MKHLLKVAVVAIPFFLWSGLAIAQQSGVVSSSVAGTGVEGQSDSGIGVAGYSNSGKAVFGQSQLNIGVVGISANNTGIYGRSSNAAGVFGETNTPTNSAVVGYNPAGVGISGISNAANTAALVGINQNGVGFAGYGISGVYGEGSNGPGLSGISKGANVAAVVGTNSSGVGLAGYGSTGVYGQGNPAGAFSGNVIVVGNVSANNFSQNSDRRLKTHFVPVNGRVVLEKIVKLPVSTWSFRDDATATRHIGPTAQDFHNAFGVGTDDTHISTIDENGVALAAIKELYNMILERDRQIATLSQELQALRGRK